MSGRGRRYFLARSTDQCTSNISLTGKVSRHCCGYLHNANQRSEVVLERSIGLLVSRCHDMDLGHRSLVTYRLSISISQNCSICPWRIGFAGCLLTNNKTINSSGYLTLPNGGIGGSQQVFFRSQHASGSHRRRYSVVQCHSEPSFQDFPLSYHTSCSDRAKHHTHSRSRYQNGPKDKLMETPHVRQ